MDMPGQGRGRPRDRAIDDRLMTATRELLETVGFAGLTVDEVARRADVGKATIYRRHGSKAELAFAATIHGRTMDPTPDTGSLHGDLLALALESHRLMSTSSAIDLAPAFMEALGSDPELLERFHRTVMAVELADLAAILDRAAARGELNRSIDASVLHLQVLGPIFAGVYGFRVPITETAIAELVTITTAGITGGRGMRTEQDTATTDS